MWLLLGYAGALHSVTAKINEHLIAFNKTVIHQRSILTDYSRFSSLECLPESERHKQTSRTSIDKAPPDLNVQRRANGSTDSNELDMAGFKFAMGGVKLFNRGRVATVFQVGRRRFLFGTFLVVENPRRTVVNACGRHAGCLAAGPIRKVS